MIKITASHSRKCPIAGKEFSSQSYHVGIEVEVAEGIGEEGIVQKSRDLFSLARRVVELELNGKAKPAQQSPVQNGQAGAQNGANGGNGNSAPSGKQLSYLLLLAKKNGGVEKLNAEIKREFGADDVAKLTRKQASGLIERMLKGGSNGR